MEERLNLLATTALEALVYCPLEEVEKYRERLKIVRHLASIREALTDERARLQETDDDDGLD
jgi:hypothetical protein